MYVINKNCFRETNDLFNEELNKYIDVPKLVEFTNKSLDLGVNINHYKEIDDLLKAIYRVKSWDI